MIVHARHALALAAIAAVTMVARPVVAQTPWIHVEVDEGAEADTRVEINLPLSVVEAALDAAPSKMISRRRIHDLDLDVADLRRIWTELKQAGDAELVSVKSRDGNVAVRREGELVRVDVTDGEDGGEVHVDVPVSVLDALLSGEGAELNIRGAVSELASLRGDVVRVDDGGKKVRVWIDEKE